VPYNERGGLHPAYTEKKPPHEKIKEQDETIWSGCQTNGVGGQVHAFHCQKGLEFGDGGFGGRRGRDRWASYLKEGILKKGKGKISSWRKQYRKKVNRGWRRHYAVEMESIPHPRFDSGGKGGQSGGVLKKKKPSGCYKGCQGLQKEEKKGSTSRRNTRWSWGGGGTIVGDRGGRGCESDASILGGARKFSPYQERGIQQKRGKTDVAGEGGKKNQWGPGPVRGRRGSSRWAGGSQSLKLVGMLPPNGW